MTTRIVMGPRVSRWWYFYVVLFGLNGVSAYLDGNGMRFAFVAGALAAAGTQAARSLRLSWISWLLAGGAMAVAAALAYQQGSWFWTALALVMVAVVVLLTPKVRREVPACRFRTEELVERTVAEATRLVGFDAGRQPGGLLRPVCVPIPPADIDPNDPSLIVTAVTIEPTHRVITFGVASRDSLPGPTRRYRAEWQQALADRVGGFPADLRPLHSPATAESASTAQEGR
ncbi:hypothetical protein [Tsukamurella strandjordii]|uniref:hypothetical protein n=1 Tax=Tsukamurella strandjordii TaxID=147577 RepID=UPI0031D535A0